MITIEKLAYSRMPWRMLVDGLELDLPAPFRHPVLGDTVVHRPICGATKAECVQAALDAFELMLKARPNNQA